MSARWLPVAVLMLAVVWFAGYREVKLQLQQIPRREHVMVFVGDGQAPLSEEQRARIDRARQLLPDYEISWYFRPDVPE